MVFDSSSGFPPNESDFDSSSMFLFVILSLLPLQMYQQLNSYSAVCILTFIHYLSPFFHFLSVSGSRMARTSEQFLGFLEDTKEGDRIGVEVNVKSDDRKKRTVHIFINGTQQKIFIENVPPSVAILFGREKKDDSVEFVRMAELKESSVKAKRDSIGYDFEGMRDL